MDELKNGAEQFGINLSPEEINKFELYFELLSAWNAHTNLTSITAKDEVVLKHFIDSLSILPYLPKNALSVMDIGSGAGLPGIPLAIARKDLVFTLIDSVGKKVAFLKEAALKLDLSNVSPIAARAEDLARDEHFRETYDVVVARAIAELAVLAEYTLPFTKIGGICIAQKIAAKEELEKARNSVSVLGGTIEQIIPVHIKGLSERHLVIIKKIKPTPGAYPRRAGIPSKRPL